MSISISKHFLCSNIFTLSSGSSFAIAPASLWPVPIISEHFLAFWHKVTVWNLPKGQHYKRQNKGSLLYIKENDRIMITKYNG